MRAAVKPRSASSEAKLETDIGFLKSAAHKYAVIDNRQGADLCAVFAGADRRRRPMGWMQKSDVETLYQLGHLKAVRKGYAFTYAAERALIEERWSLAPDLTLTEGEEKTAYVPSGVQRNVKLRNGGHILRRLAKDKNPQGGPYLAAQDIEAGERFQRDYARCHEGAVGCQSFAHVYVDRSRQNQQESSAVARIDAGRAYHAAKAVLGSGLEAAAHVICGEGKSIHRLEREHHWARGTGRVILKLALERLAVHYGTRPGIAQK